ncbi:hypothetical protein OG601_33650 [Streptomyces sp. NBC_01239]|uniref:hypothetical protein n=1 Tax=Streptomyces sp. NBC_01239 TaxID=2903792 RepID=UPI002252F60D|nr:hypothetical protein [Streptomyces sp. NBC_01239]MCX4815555.1 hypothetical protein [Streptomyces sp. NBC_01239]
MRAPECIETPLRSSPNPVFVQAHLSLTPQGRAGTVDGGYAAHGGVKAITNALDAT